MAIAYETPSHDPTNYTGRGVSPRQAEDFLATRFGSGIEAVTRVGQGEWSTAYAFRHDGVDFVIRFGAFLDDFGKDRLASHYRSRELPIPAITEIGEAYNGYYAIAERAFGEFIDDQDGAQMQALLPNLVAMLDAFRHVDLSATRGYGEWGADGSGPYSSWREALLAVGDDRPTHRTHGWRERLRTSPTGEGPFEEALGHLHALVDFCPEERHLIHSDLLNRNVLVADDRITAVIDWGCAKYGDFLYDLAWLLYWQPWYRAWRDVDFRGAAERYYEEIGLVVPHFEARLRCYQVHIGLDAQAFNAFKGKERREDLEATARRTLAVATEVREPARGTSRPAFRLT